MTWRGFTWWLFAGCELVGAIVLWVLVRRWLEWAWIWPVSGALWAAGLAAFLYLPREAPAAPAQSRSPLPRAWTLKR